MADAASETTVSVKVSEPAAGAPPTLAEPASGPVAEMSGALPSAPPAEAPKPTTEGEVTTNGAAQPPSESAVPQPATSAPEQPEQEDVEMKDAPEPSAAPAETAETPAKPTEAASTEANGTPASKGKRKPTGAAAQPKSLKKKQSKQKLTNLDAQPGNYYFARLRSYPPWPAIVCDEEMLPQTLIKTRPVTAQQADGSYKEAYAEGGKKVNDRTYPIMFLSTNEFAWIPNTDLTPLDPQECKEFSEKGKTKSLIDAYNVAAEGHDLAHFKEMLAQHEEALQADEDARAAKEAEKSAKAEKKKRKSEAKVVDGVEMEDADAEPKKSSKKRKKDAESDDEAPEKPAKTPKTKIKLSTTKTPTTDKKEKASKPKSTKKTKAVPEAVTPEEKEPSPPLDPVQARKDREKEVLFLRHKLQKGFLSRDQAPQEDEMPQMATYIKKLEAYGEELEVSIIRNTKINKVLKAMVKLNTIPKDEEFHFRERSVKLLGVWNQLLGAEPWDEKKADDKKDTSPTTTNGVHKEAEEKAEEKIEDKVEEPKENTISTEEAVDKISAEVTADAETKENAIEAVQEPTVEAPKPEEPKTEPAVNVVDAAPASSEGAAEAQNVVKATE